MTRQTLPPRRSRATMLPRRLSRSLQKPLVPESSKNVRRNLLGSGGRYGLSSSSDIPPDQRLRTCIDLETIQLLLLIWALRTWRARLSAARLWTSHFAIHNIESRAWIRANVSKESRKPRLKRYAAAHQDMPGTIARYGFSRNLEASCGSAVNNPRRSPGTGKSLAWISMIEAR